MARQVGNARNLGDSWLMRRFFVGLNSHIEHHLFQGISFTRLHEARTATREACESAGIAYHETGFFAALGEIQQLHRRMAALPSPTRKDSDYLPLQAAGQEE
jgi:fatty acid desaturase